MLYVPSTRHCLLSGPRLDQAGGEATFKDGMCQFRNCKGNLIVTGTLDGNLYRVNAKAILNQIHTAHAVAIPVLSWEETHRRMGHLSLSSLKILFNKGLVEGVEIDKDQKIPSVLDCESCIAAKSHRAPFPLQAKRQSTKFGDLTHTDVWGSTNLKHTPGGNQYFILFIDDYTRYISVKLMKNKSSVKQQIMNYCNLVHTQHGRWPKAIHSDNTAEYEGTRNWLDERGIELKTSAPYSPQQNGVSERMNWTLPDLARAMRIEKRLPETLWGEAVLHAAWIRNRSPTATLNGGTPLEMLTGKRPDLSKVREFGETVHVLDETPRSKIESKTRQVIFTGFEDGPNAIRYYDDVTKNIRISGNFFFKPDHTIRPKESKRFLNIDMIDNTIHQNHQENKSMKITNDKEIVPKKVQDETQDEIFAQNETDCLDKPSTTEDLGEMESINKRSLRAMTKSGSSTKKDYRTLAGFNPRKHIRQSDANFAAQDVFYPPSLGDYYANSPQFYQFAYSLMHKNGDEDLPNTIEEARNSHDSENWEKAIQTELDILRDKNTWELIEPPKDRNIVGNRWVFTKKFDENGNLSKYKARLVAQGFSQGFIYDYSDTFSPVVRFDSFRLLVSIAAYHNHAIGQMDIKGAYLNSNLEEEIYMRQPKGYDDGTGRVCRLKHTLYGLKQSGKEWNKTLRGFLVEKLGYKQLVKEHGIFFRKDTEGYDIIAV